MTHNSKESACNARDLGLNLGSGGSPGEENGCPLQYSSWIILWTEDLAGDSPQGCEESYMTE